MIGAVLRVAGKRLGGERNRHPRTACSGLLLLAHGSLCFVDADSGLAHKLSGDLCGDQPLDLRFQGLDKLFSELFLHLFRARCLRLPD